jgi:uncharacterized LabA/DUF88 family protein
MRTIAYVDGFNLYHRALKRTSFKWLNLRALIEAALPATNQISTINYYTARVSGRSNPTAPKDQNTYLNALKTLDGLSIYYGSFQVTEKWMYLSQPFCFLPHGITPHPVPKFVRVVKTEEKGSDVNLGVHLVRDAMKGAFEHAALLTNDSDLTEPLRIVTQELGLPVTLLCPVDTPAIQLGKLSTDVRHLVPYLGPSQFPDSVAGPKGPIHKPHDW